ncbi:MAG: ABC transporter permease subunit [Cryobacterium sp.]|nr:ABC transporter permease subunit [Cryobacterium sp.]
MSSSIRTAWVAFATFLLLLAGWWGVAAIAPSSYLPTPLAIFERLVYFVVEGGLLDDLVSTMINIAAGFFIAAALGIASGLIMGVSRLGRDTIGFFVDVFQSAPSAALVPIIVVILGFGREAMITIVVIFCYFIIAVSTAAGARSIESGLHDMSATFGASRWLFFRKVLVPGSMPMIIVGLRLAMARAFNGGILAELLISIRGFGGKMMYFGGAFDFASLYALIAVALVLTFASMAVISLVGRQLIRWT